MTSFDVLLCRKKNSFQRMKTQANLPNNAMNVRLQKMLKYRARSCLHFFDSISEQSDEDSSRSSSPSFENVKASFSTYGTIYNDENHEDTHGNIQKGQSTESSVDETPVSFLEKQRRFSNYVAWSQDCKLVSELIMEIFDNDDIEGIIPPRFLEVDQPDAIMENIRKEGSSAFLSSLTSSKRSSVDGEASQPVYDVHFVRCLRRSLRVSTASVSRISWSTCQSESLSFDMTESLPPLASQLSAQDSLATGSNGDSCTSPVNGAEYNNEPSPVLSQTNRRHRKIGIVRSRNSVLQWLANRTFSSTDSSRGSICRESSICEESISVSDSEASDVESYHSCSDDHVVAA